MTLSELITVLQEIKDSTLVDPPVAFEADGYFAEIGNVSFVGEPGDFKVRLGR